MVRVLVLGGYGLFGGRLVRRLARRPGLEVLVAGRSQAKAEALVQMLAAGSQATLRAVAFDLASAGLLESLRALQPHVVAHAAGPFQGQDYRVARACVAAGVHYIDLADSRGFVQGIAALDEEARAAGVSVLSGASSVPALSSAVVDQLAAGLASVDSIDIGISPGNRTERGLATVQGILACCGQPIGPAQGAPLRGWRGNWRHAYPAPVGERLLSPCDVPDLALLPARYPGTPRVRFGAGLELRVLHRGMNLMAWLAQRGWVRDWAAHARWLKAAADLFLRRGSDAGAMHVLVSGRDADGLVVERQWTLVAAQGDGPYVPTLAAAALVERLMRGEPLPAGARPCIGVLAHDEILAQAQGLAITAAEDSEEAMVVVFDAQCLVCSRWVRFLLARRRGGHIRFASIQGATGKRLLAEQGLQVDKLQTLLVIDRGRVWQETAAILRVLHTLGWPWRLAWAGWLVPAPLRDAAYRWAARNRYRVFGRSESCMLPAPGQAWRFLD